MDPLAGYTIGKVIGEGGFCQVRAGTHELSGRQVAVKVIQKSAHDWKRVGREIRILKRLTNHPAVIHLLDVVSLPEEVYVVQELAAGGSLLDFVRDKRNLDEDTARRLFLQIVAGLQFCHRQEVIHRDVKLENILMDKEGNTKLIDFGLAAVAGPRDWLSVHCGSPSYAAPEIVGRKWYLGPAADAWSLGIVTFAMVAGHLPFHSRNGRTELSQKILAGRYQAPAHMSEHMQDAVASLLDLDPTSRATLPQLCSHRWVTGSLAAQSVRLPPRLLRRARTDADAAQHAHMYDDAILNHMEAQLHVPRGAVVRATEANECNHVSATYFLLAEARRARRPPPATTSSLRAVGAGLPQHVQHMARMHGFSLDEDEPSDRDDASFFAQKSSRVAA